MDQSQTTRYILRFEPLLYVPAFTQKDFHYIVHTGLPTQGTSTEDLGNTNREYTTPLSNNTTSTQEVRHNNYHLYTQRDGHLAKQQSTSHQRDKAQSQYSNNHLFTKRDNNKPNCITSSTLRGKGTKPTLQQSPLHLKGYQPNQTQPPQSPLIRGISTQPPQSPLTRGISQSKEGLQLLVVSTTTNQFSHKTRS